MEKTMPETKTSCSPESIVNDEDAITSAHLRATEALIDLMTESNLTDELQTLHAGLPAIVEKVNKLTA